MKINEGDRVGLIENGQLLRGIVKNVYPEINIAVVKFDCGDIEKVALTNLAVLPEEKDQDPKEPVIKSEITIKRDEFRKIAVKLVANEAKEMSSGIVGIAFSIFVAKLEKALFIEG